MGGPYIRCFPVVEGVCVHDVAINAVRPFKGTEVTVVFVAVDGAPTVEALLSAYADQTAHATALFAFAHPFGEQALEIIIPQSVVEKIEIVGRITAVGHFSYPYIFF